jgi:hypothetical protein
MRTTTSRRTGEQETAGERGLGHRACGGSRLSSFTCSTVQLLACSVAPVRGYRERGEEEAAKKALAVGSRLNGLRGQRPPI